MRTMMDYIYEEQMTLMKILSDHQFTRKEEHTQTKNILILATGSSFNACLAAKIAFEFLADVSVTIEEPYHFNHYGRISEYIDTVIAVSQSGKSASTINAISKLKQQNVHTIGLTSDLNSPLCKHVDETIDLGTGIETVGFVTKGYVSTILQLFLLGISIGKSKGELTNEQVRNYKIQLIMNINNIPGIIEKSLDFFRQNESIFKIANRFVAIGYGSNWGTVKEIETKFTETIRKPSQGFELEAYMHGPYLEANNEHILFFIETSDDHRSRSNQLCEYMTPYVGKAYRVTANSVEQNDTLSLNVDCDELFSSLFLIIPFQIFAYHGATAKGIDLSKRIFDDFDQVLKSKI